MYIVIGEQEEWRAMQCSKFKAPCRWKTHSYSACCCVPQTDSQLGPALISWQQYWHRNRNSDEYRTLAVASQDCLHIHLVLGVPPQTYVLFKLDSWWFCIYSLTLGFKGTVSHFGNYVKMMLNILPNPKGKYVLASYF